MGVTVERRAEMMSNITYFAADVALPDVDRYRIAESGFRNRIAVLRRQSDFTARIVACGCG